MDGKERVHGPYRHGKRWRLVFVDAAGGQAAESFATEGECRRRVAALRKQIEGRSVGDAVTEYLAWHADRVRSRTLETDTCRLTGFFRLREPEWQDLPLSALADRAPTIYRMRVAETRPDTHRAELALASRACEWWMRQPRAYLTRNPFESVEPVGRKTRGKPQPRWDEARRLLGAVLSDTSERGSAVATALLLGLRATEVVERVVRDVDDGGRLLWIPDSKTPNGIGSLEIPGVLQPRLLALTLGRAPEDRLFGDVDRHWLYRAVKAFGREVGVRVTPHVLRGLHSTTARREGATGEMVARALGHGSAAVARRHYIAPGTERFLEARGTAIRLLETRVVTHGGADSGDTTPGLVTETSPPITNERNT